MWERTVKTAKAIQPISTTGMFAHAYNWLTSPSGDQVYYNPFYDKEGNPELETAIYFIHGTADQSSAFQNVAERLIQAGLPNEISSLNLLSFNNRYEGKSIEFFAEQLGDKIKANHHRRVILIAHSRGGLVASYFAEFLAKLAGIEVLLIIPIGAPFNGSYLAMKPLSWFSDSVKEMEIDSSFLKQLKEKIINSSTIPYHFFIAIEDAIVPGESGYIKEYVDKNPNSLSKLDRHGHLSIMSSHRLVELIAFLLRKHLNAPLNDLEVIVSKMGEINIIDDYCSQPESIPTPKVTNTGFS
ncbi:putative lipase [Legionella steigerwaltii]|uniref:Lipase n=1 Tax=Legionella steigerwaltii TaxID=460 RepID=A0A378L778_9GAMM|nr:alpha/beta hydrolase [Legionella steigerwaltii]KTD77459.1 putative lipase [Legionella steigerwaltii]STY22686.1 putative lipase [Legionella steigerwaltii]